MIIVIIIIIGFYRGRDAYHCSHAVKIVLTTRDANGINADARFRSIVSAEYSRIYHVAPIRNNVTLRADMKVPMCRIPFQSQS